MVKKKKGAMRMLIAIGLAITMIFAVVALSACNTDPTLLQQTDSLGQQVYAAQNGGNPTIAEIDALLAELEALRADVIRLEGENSELLARIDGYKAQLNELRNGGNLMQGVFLTLQNAYSDEFISRNDIKHISYFAMGRVVEVLDPTENIWENELFSPENYWTRIKAVDFTPTISAPSSSDVSSQVVASMKAVFYAANRELMDVSLQQEIDAGNLVQGTTALSTISILAFYGSYNGSYAVRITSSLWGYGGTTVPQLVSNIGWSLPSAPPIMIFR